MDFISVELKKFLSHLHTKIDLRGEGLTLIEGDNGVGKTSMLDAVSWCLFGKTIRKIKDDNVVNRKYKADTEVITTLKKGSYVYTIKRYRKHHEFGNRLMYMKKGTITRDIRTIEEGTVDLTQAKLLRDLDIDFDLFRCTVLFGQEDQFNFVSETNAEQKKILSKIMRVDFKKYLDNTKAANKEAETRLTEIDKKLAVLRSHEGDPDEQWAEAMSEWDQKHTERLGDIRKEIADLKSELAKVEARVQDHDVAGLKDLQVRVKEKLAELDEIDYDVGGAKALVTQLETEIARHSKLQKAGRCPTCEAPVAGDKCQREIAKLTKMLEVAKQGVETAVRQTSELKAKRQKFQEKAEAIKDKLRAASDDETELRELNEAIGEARGRLKEEKEEVNPFIKVIAEAKAKQKEIKAKYKQLETEQAEIRDRVPYLDFWSKAFGDDGIKSFIFDLICATLTEKANEYLNVLTGGDIQVSFDTQKKLKTGELREKFDCQVILDGEAMPYENYSGGQKTRISLAVDMALSDLMSDQYGSKFNIVAFDEQTTYMNEKGRRGFMNLLTKVAEKRGVYVVDHDAEFKAQFDNVITVKMKSGVSHVSV